VRRKFSTESCGSTEALANRCDYKNFGIPVVNGFHDAIPSRAYAIEAQDFGTRDAERFDVGLLFSVARFIVSCHASQSFERKPKFE
jgi:hypothetical protein